MRIKKLAGLVFTCAVALVPVLLWLLFSSLPLSFSDTTQKLDIIAKISALSGLSLLAFNIILSARLSVFERLFLGLDRAYRAHRIIGGTIVILFMLHGGLITAKYSSISLLSGFEFLKPNLDVALMLGKIALFVMIILVTVSVYTKIKYQWFVTAQRVLGAMIFFGGYHALFVSGSDLRNNLPLLTYFVLIGGLSSALYIYRSLFHKTIRRKLQYIVYSFWHSQGITVIWLKPSSKALAFYAGQFAFFQFTSAAVDGESHPFSISSGSDNSYLRIAVKSSGDFTTGMERLKTGDLVRVEGPYGHFSFSKIRSMRQVWVAGGIGITPFLSMAQSLSSDQHVTLYYCVRTLSQAVFLEELEKVMIQKPGLKVITMCDDQDQRISATELVSNSPEDYLLCAPPLMMHSLEKQLKALGVKKSNIFYEDFALI